MKLETMNYEVRDGVAHVCFARSDCANSINTRFSRDLSDIMLVFEWDDRVKAV